jgi:hypothetical protein
MCRRWDVAGADARNNKAPGGNPRLVKNSDGAGERNRTLDLLITNDNKKIFPRIPLR